MAVHLRNVWLPFPDVPVADGGFPPAFAGKGEGLSVRLLRCGAAGGHQYSSFDAGAAAYPEPLDHLRLFGAPLFVFWLPGVVAKRGKATARFRRMGPVGAKAFA
ncbi:MAG: hypothetical protein HFF16_03465 [Angelakisella sp.]|nr:hypothetical protein [Angelakisella sp.]MCI9528738.1 hypothetical protein [Angelakisella sp.]